MFYKIGNGFYRLFCFHCEYSSVQKFENVVFSKNSMFEQTQFEKWAWKVLDFTQIYRQVCFIR